jgi:hypothetical protein
LFIIGAGFSTAKEFASLNPLTHLVSRADELLGSSLLLISSTSSHPAWIWQSTTRFPTADREMGAGIMTCIQYGSVWKWNHVSAAVPSFSGEFYW